MAASRVDRIKTLIEQGVRVIPIKKGSKGPSAGLRDWPSLKIAPEDASEYFAIGTGVGVGADSVPGLDVDIEDRKVTAAVIGFFDERYGEAPIRVGRAPRVFIPCSPNACASLSQWPKIEIKDAAGGSVGSISPYCHKGQQWVAYHIHPRTLKPYEWKRGTLLNYSLSDFPEPEESDYLALIDLIKSRFPKFSVKSGRLKNSGTRNPSSDESAILAKLDSSPLEGYSASRIDDEALTFIDSDDYEQWVMVGMALHHQFSGTEEGFNLYNSWSSKSDKYTGSSAVRRKWKSFSDITEAPGDVVTLRSILVLPEVVEARVAAVEKIESDDSGQILEQFRSNAKSPGVTPVQLERMILAVQKKIEDATGSKPSKAALKDELKTPKDLNDEETPKWGKDWVFIMSEDKLVRPSTGVRSTASAFNTAFSRKAIEFLGEKGAKPSIAPLDLVMNVFKAPVVARTCFIPGKGKICKTEGVVTLNLWKRPPSPKPKKDWSQKDAAAVQVFIDHVNFLVDDEFKAGILLSWLSFVYTSHATKATWGVYLQGAGGDGKSVLGTLMRNILGSTNCRSISPNLVRSDFNEWAEGSRFSVIEEVRILGSSRYDIANSLKPLISDPVVPLNVKHSDSRDANNYTDWLLLSNYKDGLPMSEWNRRYFVIFSRFSREEDARKFERDNPRYFPRLFRSVNEHYPALAGWLKEYKWHEDFDPLGSAPWTDDRKAMAGLGRNDTEITIDNALEDDQNPFVTPSFISSTYLKDSYDLSTARVSSQFIARTLTKRGYSRLGRHRIGSELHQIWSGKKSKTTIKKFIVECKKHVKERGVL